MILLFDKNISQNSNKHQLDFEQSHHINIVLRKANGCNLTVTNGKGLEWLGEIYSYKNGKVELKRINSKIHKKTKKMIHLIIAPTKNIKRMEWMLEKLTEMGINSITPIICYHSERKYFKRDRLIKIMISALKQSKQFFLPKLNAMTTFENYITITKDPFFIAHCRDKNIKKLLEIKLNNSNDTILIGPEGDFSKKEIKLSIDFGGIPVSLGNNILRTETAGIIACQTIMLKQQLNNI